MKTKIERFPIRSPSFYGLNNDDFAPFVRISDAVWPLVDIWLQERDERHIVVVLPNYPVEFNDIYYRKEDIDKAMVLKLVWGGK